MPSLEIHDIGRFEGKRFGGKKTWVRVGRRDG